MDVLEKEIIKLQRDSSFDQSIEDVDKIIQQLEKARDAIESGTYILNPRRSKSAAEVRDIKTWKH